MIIRNQFFRNLVSAFLAQGVGLVLNVILSLAVPKVLGITEYGYWQLFIFYTGYVGFFHFGWADGIYLRLGGKDYKNLDYKTLGVEYRFFLVMESLIAILVVVAAYGMVDDANRIFVFVGTAVYMVLYNATLYLNYIFQAVNEIKTYALSVIMDRIFLLAVVIVLLFAGEESYIPFIISYVVSKFISLAYLFYKGKKIVFVKLSGYRDAMLDTKENILVGSNLMLANIASLMILGVGRVVIDQIWGINFFGKISFSLSLTNFFLLFIQQVSMVLFPFLRKIQEDKLTMAYSGLKTVLEVLLPISLVLYVPIKCILIIWLPEYAESLEYLALLLPVCIFDGKMQMLYNTYLKVLREEKKMLQINVISLLVSVFLAGVCGFILHNFFAVIISMLAAVAFRCIVAELYLARKMHISSGHNFIAELLVVVIFVLVSWQMPDLQSFIIVVCVYICYLLTNSKKLVSCLKMLKTKP
ncbi:lipopolysaccharide biosynthesis protein [Mordavella massiliensis]|uniref:Polysaccharide biosynthesis protein n=1 Tax=Mordavella massiliensis TaxID=1871024 RepID=A0A938XDQ7_9CLOT|nr:hypothetical protein [Mordavella massiliensis]MBM6948823.1 hypothetical protein [Mordavella massiliensis]